MQGYEFSYLPCLVLGAKGYVGVSFSLCAPVYHRLDKAFHEGDFATAQRLQLAVSDFLTTVLNYSMIPAVKALAKEVLSQPSPTLTWWSSSAPAHGLCVCVCVFVLCVCCVV
jgi:dihydrodipicolinate synthase/N-acetylneuraminate lyase